MSGEHPKRKKDKYNPYKVYRKDGKAYLKFKDGTGKKQKLEINEELYAVFDCFEREDSRQIDEVRRHIERFDKLDDGLNDEALYRVEGMEETILRKIQREELHYAMMQLPEVQRRRLILYYFKDYNYSAIADVEHCSISGVSKSIREAKKSLKKLLEWS